LYNEAQFSLSAAFQDSFDCVELLLAKNAETNCRDVNLRTPLMMAAYKGHLRIVGEKRKMVHQKSSKIHETWKIFQSCCVKAKAVTSNWQIPKEIVLSIMHASRVTLK